LSHVFCNPTYEDNFPTTNLEALACGTPVITYRTGGSVEAIDAETGLVVEKGDVAGLYEAVMTVVAQPKEQFAAKCRTRAVAKWNKEERFKEYLDLYNEIHEKSHHT
jgi:glycosyltransferase involved in cell wall biosynthesis